MRVMICSFCQRDATRAVVSGGSVICQPCTTNAVTCFARAWPDLPTASDLSGGKGELIVLDEKRAA